MRSFFSVGWVGLVCGLSRTSLMVAGSATAIAFAGASATAWAQSPSPATPAPVPPASPGSAPATGGTLLQPPVIIESPRIEPKQPAAPKQSAKAQAKTAPAKGAKSAPAASPAQTEQASTQAPAKPVEAMPVANPATITKAGTGMPVSVQENPLSVSVVGQEQLARRPVESVAEALRDVPGVEVVDSSAAGMKRVRIRGESSRRVKILVDGQEITDHSTYGSPVLIDPAGVERIDVVRGPGSILYGGQAVGGVVNIITKRGAAKPVEVELGGGYYSGTKGYQGSAAVSGTVDRFDYRVSGSLADHNEREVPKGGYSTTGRLDGTAFNTDELSAHLGLTLGEAKNHYVALKFLQHRLDTQSWTDPATLTGGVTKFFINLPERDLRKVGLFYDGHDLGPVLKRVHFDAYYQDVSRVFVNEVGVTQALPGGTTLNVATNPTSTDLLKDIGSTGQLDFKFHPAFYTIVGASFLSDRLDTSKTTTTVTTTKRPAGTTTRTTFSSSVDEAHIDTAAAFAQNEWAITSKLKLTTGVRYFHIANKLDSSTDPVRATWKGGDEDGLLQSAGLVFTAIPNTTLRAAYTEGYATPTLLQMFSTTTAGGTTVYGNPSLGLERSRNYELGARYFANGLVIDTTGFYTAAKDYIASVACTAATCPSATGRVYDNIDTAATHGVEVLVQYTLPGTRLTPYATGTWSRRQYDYATYSTWNTDLPAYSGRAGLRYEWQVAGIRAWSDLFIRSSTGVAETLENSGKLETKTLAGWRTLNLAFGGTAGKDDKYTFGIALNNLTNEDYRSSFGELPGTARSFEAVARIKF